MPIEACSQTTISARTCNMPSHGLEYQNDSIVVL
jgi:hypothetical protein